MESKFYDKSIHRMTLILDILSFHSSGLSFTDINKAACLPKSSLNSILSYLQEKKMVKYIEESKKYYFGSYFWELSMNFIDNLQIDEIAHPYLEKFRNKHNKTVQMAILDQKDIIYLKKIPAFSPMQLASRVGSRIPAYATGLGKALLSCLTEEEICYIYPHHKLETYTSTTISNRDTLMKELIKIREKKYANDFGEYTNGVYCYDVLIVGFQNRHAFSISFSMTEAEFNSIKETKIESMVEDLMNYSKEMNSFIGNF